MNLTLSGIAIGSGPGAALPPTSATATSERPGVAAVETEGAPTLASLIAGGRMAPDAGRVTLDGLDDPARIRSAFALVDTPTVAEPFADLSVVTVTREELVLADRRGSADDARRFLAEIGLDEHETTRIRALPTEARVRLLCELAILRPGVRGLILTSPQRHGGGTEAWLDVVLDLSRRGYTVLIIASIASAEHIEQLLPEPQAPEPTPADDVDGSPSSVSAPVESDQL